MLSALCYTVLEFIFFFALVYGVFHNWDISFLLLIATCCLGCNINVWGYWLRHLIKRV